MTTPPGRGLWPAFWSWFSRAETPQTGEVDFAELVGRDPNTLYSFVHGVVPGSPPWIYQNGAELHHSEPLSGKPHTYEVRTEPGVVEFWFDGKQYGSAARADLPPDAPWVIRPDLQFRLILNIAIGSWAGPPDSTTPLPAQMTVDGVSVWRWRERPRWACHCFALGLWLTWRLVHRHRVPAAGDLTAEPRALV